MSNIEPNVPHGWLATAAVGTLTVIAFAASAKLVLAKAHLRDTERYLADATASWQSVCRATAAELRAGRAVATSSATECTQYLERERMRVLVSGHRYEYAAERIERASRLRRLPLPVYADVSADYPEGYQP